MLIILGGLLTAGTSDASGVVQASTATASNRIGNSMPLFNGRLNPLPAAPLGHGWGDMSSLAQATQPTPVFPTATGTAEPAKDPVPTATQPPTRPVATSTPIPPPPQSVPLQVSETALLESQNLERHSNGLAPLTIDSYLVNVARQRSQRMAVMSCFSHTACGATAFELLDQTGYSYRAAAENLARNNYPDSVAAHVAFTGFMNSPGHRASILDSRFTRVGIGVAFGPNGMKYFTVVYTGP